MTAPFPRIEAPDRTVCALTGTTEVEQLRADLGKAIEDRDDVKAKLDNVMYEFRHMGERVKFLTSMMSDFHTERDDAVDAREEWRDKFDEACDQRDEAYARIDELQAELEDVRGEKKWGES